MKEIFAWEQIKEKSVFYTQLRKTRLEMDNNYPFYNTCLGDINHMLMQCKLAKEYMSKILYCCVTSTNENLHYIDWIK